MVNYKISLVAVMIGFLAIIPAYGQNSPTSQTSTPNAEVTDAKPKIRCDQPVYEFPEVWGGDKVEHTFILHNDGNADLEITKVRGGCGCTTIPGYDKVIPPGKQGKVTFIVQTSTRSTTKTVHPTVSSNDPTTPNLRLTITGKLKQRISIDPSTGASWGRVSQDMEVAPKKITITNNTPTPLKLEPIETTVKSIFTWTMKEIEPGKIFEITVTANPPFKDGYNRTYLQFKTGLKDMPIFRIPCYLFSPPLVEINPSYGIRVTLPSDANQPIRPGRAYIRYNGEGEMKIDSAKCTNPKIEVDLKTQVPGRSFSLTIKIPDDFEPNPQENTRIIISSNVTNKLLEIPVRIIQPRVPPQRKANTAADLIGKPAPKVTLKKADNSEIILGAINNKVTVLNFWASYCPHCKKQLPLIEEIYKEYASKGVEFLNICTDVKGRKGKVIAEVAKQLGASAPVALDSTKSASLKYGVKSLPTLLLVGKTGTIEQVHKGSGAGTEAQAKARKAQIRADLDALLAGKSLAAAKETKVIEPAISGPKLVFVPNSTNHDTGRHKPGETINHTIKYQNSGTEPLELKSVKSDSDNLKIISFDKKLEAGKPGKLECEFQVPKQPGEFTYKLSLETNDPTKSKAEINLKGITRDYIEVDPPTGVDFSRKVPTNSMPRLATLIYNGTGTVQYLAVQSNTPKFEATVKPIRQGPNAMVIVKAKPPFDPGENKGEIGIRTSCKEQPIVKVPVKLFLPPRIEITPEKVKLKKSRRLQRSSVSIINNGMAPMHILGVTSSNKKIRTQFYPEPDGRSYKLELILPSGFSNGPDPDTVTIRTDDKEHGEIVIPITVD